MSNQSNEPRFVTCRCQHCDGNIEFDASSFEKGETRTEECPHCHLETIIFVPHIPTEMLTYAAAKVEKTGPAPPVIKKKKLSASTLFWVYGSLGVFLLILFSLRGTGGATRENSDMVSIADFHWWTDEAGEWNLAVTIKNGSTNDIKDIDIVSEFFAPSGTEIDSANQTIYQIIKAGQQSTFNVDMGYVNSQATRGNARIAGFQTMD